MGSRKHDAPPPGTALGVVLVALLTAVVILALLLYPAVASGGTLRASDRAGSASLEVSTPVLPDVDQRVLAEPAVAGVNGAEVREWTASAPVDVVPSGGSAVNLPADLRVSAVGWPGSDGVDSRAVGPDDGGYLGAVVTAADADRFGLSDGDTLAVATGSGTLRVRVLAKELSSAEESLLRTVRVEGVLVLGVSPADVALFSDDGVLGWQFLPDEDASGLGLREAAAGVSGFADALEATGAAPGGTMATGDLPSVLTEAAAAFRVATTVAINGALLVVLVGLSLVVPARRRAPGVPSRPGWHLAAAAVGTAIVAVLAPLLVEDRGGIPPLSVAPGALIAVVALLVAVFLPRGVPALRGGTVPASPPTKRAASRPLLQRAVVFAVVTSIGAGVLGAAVLGSTDAAARSTAALANGGDVRIVLPSTAGTAGASGLQLPDGTASTRVLRTDLDLDGAATELVAVDSFALPAVLPSGSPIDADRLADDLRPPIPAPEPALDLQPTARQVRLQLTTAPLDAAVDAPAAALRAQVVAWLEREDGTLQRVAAGTLSITPDQTQQHSLSFSLPEDLRPERIAAVDLVLSPAAASATPSAGFALALASSSSDTGIGTGESRFAASSDLAVVPGLPGATEAGVQNLLEGAGFSVETLSAQPLTVRLAPRAAADGVAVVAPSSLGAAESQDLILTLGGAGLPAVVVAVLPAVPGEVAGPAVLADLRTVSYALLSTLEGPPGAGELWVSAPDPGSLAASLREATPDGTLMTTATADPLGASLVPLVWLTAGACLLGAFYLVLRSPGAQPAGPIGRNGVLLVVAGALLGLVAGVLAAATLGPALGLGDGLLLRDHVTFDPRLLLVTLVAALGFVGSSVLRGITPGKRRTVP